MSTTNGVSVLDIAGGLERERAVEASWRAWYAKHPRMEADPCPSPDAPLGPQGVRVHFWKLTMPPYEYGTCVHCGKTKLHRSPEQSTKENLQPFNNVKVKVSPVQDSPKERALAALAAIPRGETRLLDHSDGLCERQTRLPGKYTCVLYGYVTLSNRRHGLAGKLSIVKHQGPGMAEVRRENP